MLNIITKNKNILKVAECLLIITGITAFFIVIVLLYKNPIHPLLIFIVPATITGLVIENRRLSTPWRLLLRKFSIALLLSIILFVVNPGIIPTTYQYLWPLIFSILFSLFSIQHHKEKVIPKIDEGITLIQSLSIMYWIFDIHIPESYSPVAWVGIILSSLFILLSLIHALSNIQLTRFARLWLSIWSSIIMLVFALGYIHSVYLNTIHVSPDEIGSFVLVVQYFLLGISCMYIIKNIQMLIVYLPRKDDAYDSIQMIDIKKTNQYHTARYSSKQLSIPIAAGIIIILSLTYYLNHHYNFLPRNTLIWCMFWLSPFTLKNKEAIIY